MGNYIMINGVKLELTPEQVAALTAEPVKDDPFERRRDAAFYYIDFDGTIGYAMHEYDDLYDNCYAVANYCRDEEKMRQRALHEILDRRLWRYSEQHGGDPEWDGQTAHWNIFRDVDTGEWETDYWYTCKQSGPYFCSKEVAEAAIHNVVEPFCADHPEFVWWWI